jgi:hypothetical protein
MAAPPLGRSRLHLVRGLLARTHAEIDQELGVDDEPPAGVSPTNWRKSGAHPPLNDEGVAEIERRKTPTA